MRRSYWASRYSNASWRAPTSAIRNSSLYRCSARAYASTPPHHKHEPDRKKPTIPHEAPKPSPIVESIKPESIEKKAGASPAGKDTLLAEQTVSNKEQRKADWAIMKEMSRYLWPKDNMGTRFRVGVSVALLVGAKLLNVQVPFYFKSIVDSMNIDFIAVGGTAWTVAGSMIIACQCSVRVLK